MAPRPERILVELDSGVYPIAGRVTAGRQPAVLFSGWTGLFAVLRAAAGEDGHGQDGGGRGGP
jgi:hypothetical protein